jgi:hypothetical protein
LRFGAFDHLLPGRQVTHVEDRDLDAWKLFAEPRQCFPIDVDCNDTVSGVDAKARDGCANAFGCSGYQHTLCPTVRR